MTDEKRPAAYDDWSEPKLDPPPDDELLGAPPIATIKRGWVIGLTVGAATLLLGSVGYAMVRDKTPVRSEREMQPRTYGNASAKVPESIRQLEMATTPAAPTRVDDDTPPEVVAAKPAIRFGDNTPEPPIAEESVPADLGVAPAPRFSGSGYPSGGPMAHVASDRDEHSDEAAMPWVVPSKGMAPGLANPSTPSLPTQTPGVVQPAVGGGQLQQLREALEQAQGASAPSDDPDDRKEAFAARQGGIETLSSDGEDLAECDLSAGRPVAANVLVSTNSDVPAENTVAISVTQTVYCGADRQYVAIPQGATFVGSVNAHVGYGDERQQLCMKQLNLPPSLKHPTGFRKKLGCFVVADITGAPGMPADVDNHWSQLIAGSVLSAILSIGVTVPTGSQQGFAPTIAQNAAHNLGNNVNQVGARIVQRDLQRKPTLKTEQLEGVMVMFSSNLELEPWQPRNRR